MDINCRKAMIHTLKLALRTAIWRALQNSDRNRLIPLSSSRAVQSYFLQVLKQFTVV